MQEFALEKSGSLTSRLQRFPVALALLIGLLAAPGAWAATMPTQAQILSDMTLANHYFTNEWPNPGCSSCLSGSHPSSIWTRGTYFEGALAMYRITHDTAMSNYAMGWGNFHNWQLRYGAVDTTADDQCAGSEFIELYLMDTTKPYRITNTVGNLNYWMFTNSTKLDYYWYIDGVHMSMPAFAKMVAISGSTNANYSSKLYSYWNYCKSTIGPSHGLYNTTDHLWYRDTNYVSGYKASDGTSQKCYWSRGNGWVFAGLARALEVLPSSDAHFAEYAQTFQDMAAALKPAQQPDGFWYMNLAYANDCRGPESSGTAMFTYGLAWGINRGYLDRATYLPTVINGWNALAVGSLHHSPTNSDPGFIGWVQSTGLCPDNTPAVTYTSPPDFDDFTLGALLLAGSEVYQLAGPSQMVYFGRLSDHAYGDAPVTLSASASSGLPVSFSILSGPASLAGNVLTITGAGTVTVRASQAGNGSWNAAPNVDQSFNVSPKALTVAGTLSVPASKVYDGTTTGAGSGTAALLGAEAPGAGTTSDGLPYSGDTVNLTGTPSYAYNSKDVATASTVTVSGLSLAGASSGSYTLSALSFSATITAKALTVTGLSAGNKTYNGNTTATLSGTKALLAAETAGTGASTDGKPYSVDAVSAGGTAAGVFADENAGTAKSVTVSGVTITGTGNGNYTATQPAGLTANITAAALTVTATGVSKVYDGTMAATVTLSDTPVSGDVVTASYTSASFADKNAGTGKTVSVSGISLGGADAGNYTLANPTASTTANITPLPVQLSGSRVYDGTTAAAGASLSVVNKITGDDVGLSGSAVLAGKNVGSQAIVANYAAPARVQYNSNSTSGANSFTVTLSAAPANGNTLVAVITTRRTSASAVSSINASGGVTWQRAVQSTGTAGSTTEIWYAPNVQSATAGITINLAANSFAAAAVVMEYSGVLIASPLDVSNFANGSTSPASTGSATTTQANEVWVGGIGFRSGSGYTYTVSSGSLASFANAQSGTTTTSDKIYALDYIASSTGSANSSGTLGTATAWSGAIATFKAASGSALALAGAQAGDYTVTGLSGSATITAKALTVTGVSVPASKVYDGTTATAIPSGPSALLAAEAPGSGTSNDGTPYIGDTVSISGTATGTYDAADVATASLVTFTGLSTANSNYTLTPPTQAATVTPLPLTAALTGTVSKMYDGTTAAILMAGNYSLPGILSGDTVILNNPASGTYDTRNVGAAKTVSVAGLQLTGTSVGNYALSSTSASGAIGAISRLPITVAAVMETKTYDGTTSASGIPAIAPALASGDSATILSQAFQTKDVGTGNKMIVPSIVINDGNGGNNYTVTLQNFATGTISQAPLTVTADSKTKVYGDADPALTYKVTGGSMMAGDSFAGSLARVAGENAGSYAIQQDSLTAGANYNLAYLSANLVITPRDLVAQADDTGRAYGQTNPVFTITYTGFIGADTVTNLMELPQGSALADTNSPIGTYDITLMGGSDTNYSLVLSNGTLTITVAALTVSADPQTKAYGDPDPTFTWQITSGALIGADALQGVLSRETGESKGLYAIQQGALVAGTNYTLTFVPANLTINPRAITVTADPKTKAYGDPDPALTCQVTGGSLVPGDSLTGDLTRAAGENAGPYAIQQGTVTAGANYNLAFQGADLTISRASSANALISSQNPSAQGSDVTFTATLTAVLPATTMPTGTVQFSVNGAAFGSPVPLDGSGVASFSTALLSSGSNTVAATYSGDVNFLGSAGSLVQTVNLSLVTPSALAIKNNGDGTITLTFQGTPGGKYVIQAAENFSAPSWQSFSTNTVGADGCCTLIIPATQYKQRFFHPVIP